MIILPDSTTSDWWVFSITYNINIMKYVYIYIYKHIHQSHRRGPGPPKKTQNHLCAAEALDQQSFPLRFVWPRGFGYRECREGLRDVFRYLKNPGKRNIAGWKMDPDWLKMCFNNWKMGVPGSYVGLPVDPVWIGWFLKSNLAESCIMLWHQVWHGLRFPMQPLAQSL